MTFTDFNDALHDVWKVMKILCVIVLLAWICIATEEIDRLHLSVRKMEKQHRLPDHHTYSPDDIKASK